MGPPPNCWIPGPTVTLALFQILQFPLKINLGDRVRGRSKKRFKVIEERQVEGQLKKSGFNYNERFLEFIKLFAQIGADSRIFPKTCHTCGRVYRSFPEYIHNTSPIAHCLEEYGTAMDANFTMQYRNCDCGSTLTIVFTKKTYPLLDRFWEMIGKESKATGRPLREVVTEFREQCNRYVVEKDDPPRS
jgi:hypothetical protein